MGTVKHQQGAGVVPFVQSGCQAARLGRLAEQAVVALALLAAAAHLLARQPFAAPRIGIDAVEGGQGTDVDTPATLALAVHHDLRIDKDIGVGRCAQGQQRQQDKQLVHG